jgi:hypothetical protein
MTDEYWGTLSIYDHRFSVFYKALVLFDRIVIPVPKQPIYDITEQELEALDADAQFLAEHDAAVRYSWSPEAFDKWCKDLVREALAAGTRDALYNSRLMLQHRAVDLKPMHVEEVVAVPVYGARDGYDSAIEQLAPLPEQLLTLEIAQNITVPSGPVPLEVVVDLRARPAFRAAMHSLRKWQTNTLPEVATERSRQTVRAAARDFEHMIKRYEEAIQEGRFQKQKACVVSILVLAGATAAAVSGASPILSILASAAPALYSLAEAKKPAWKRVQDKDYAAAGVIYEANEAFKRYRRSV